MDYEMSTKKSVRPEWHLILWILALGGSLGSVLAFAFQLILPPYIARSELYSTYLLFSIMVVVFLHVVFFGWNSLMQRELGKTLPKNTPRYLEYAYAALLSLGLLQIFFMSPNFIKYMVITSGDEVKLVTRIRQFSEKHLNEDCLKGGSYFPPSYCEKLKKLVEAKNTESYITNNVLTDEKFLGHVIGKRGNPAGGLDNVVSPIRREARTLINIRDYQSSPTIDPRRPVMTWIAFILLPLGIGLRILKTSLELFGNLK